MFEIVLVWESLLAILAAIFVWRTGKNTREEPTNSKITTTSWLLIVIHSNITCYFWITYYIVDNVYGCTTWSTYSETALAKLQSFNRESATIQVVGAISLGIGIIISVVAAIGNDMLYPDAQVSPREAAFYINHLKKANPEMNVVLKSRVRLTDNGHQFFDSETGRRVDISYIGYPNMPNSDNWKRPKKVFQPATWKDKTLTYPNIQAMVAKQDNHGINNNYTQSMMLKVTLAVNPQTDNARKDLNKCVQELARECGQRERLSWISNIEDQPEDVIEDKYKLHATIPPTKFPFVQEALRRSRRSLGSRIDESRGKGEGEFPTLSIEKPIYIFVKSTRIANHLQFTSTTDLSTEFFIRFAWVLNLIGCSGLVLFFLSIMHNPTITLNIQKKYSSRSLQTNSSDNNANNTGEGTDLVVNLISNGRSSNQQNINSAATAADDGGFPNFQRSNLLQNRLQDVIGQLPMPPPYTSREPSIARHPMTPPPQYTSILGLNNLVDGAGDLHVNIPEEQDVDNANIEVSSQPPSYQEAINSENSLNVINEA